MELLLASALAVLFAFPLLYGEAENRLFKEAGEVLPCGHFKFYHLWLAVIFGGTGFLVYAVSGSLLLAGSYLVWAPLGLDMEWWTHRWLDFTYRVQLWGFAVFLGRDEAIEHYNGELNAWHERPDWDNYLGLPLVQVGRFRCYWWWPLCGAISAGLFVAHFMVI